MAENTLLAKLEIPVSHICQWPKFFTFETVVAVLSLNIIIGSKLAVKRLRSWQSIFRRKCSIESQDQSETS
jgi:hypothetical protein